MRLDIKHADTALLCIQGRGGRAGFKGPLGNKGGDGPVGPVGEPGQRGPTGIHGRTGSPGDIGPDGNTGSSGDKGEVGRPGVPGHPVRCCISICIYIDGLIKEVQHNMDMFKCSCCCCWCTLNCAQGSKLGSTFRVQYESKIHCKPHMKVGKTVATSWKQTEVVANLIYFVAVKFLDPSKKKFF